MNASYAAIRITRYTILELFSHIHDVPDGRSRLAWALFQYQWLDDKEFFFIGGNYLHLNQPDYSKQILSRAQLDERFTHSNKRIDEVLSKKQKEPWFLVTPREGIGTNGKVPASSKVS